jgi:ribosome-binding protein aMBF1 (putative translation factor)
MATKTDSNPAEMAVTPDRAKLEKVLRKLPTEMTRLPKPAAKAKRVKAKKPAKAKAKAKAKAAKPAQRADSKQAKFIAAMRTARGMSIDEAAKAFDWQKHTVRGAIAGAIKKRLGLKVEAEQDDKRGTVYRIKK